MRRYLNEINIYFFYDYYSNLLYWNYNVVFLIKVRFLLYFKYYSCDSKIFFMFYIYFSLFIKNIYFYRFIYIFGVEESKVVLLKLWNCKKRFDDFSIMLRIIIWFFKKLFFIFLIVNDVYWIIYGWNRINFFWNIIG